MITLIGGLVIFYKSIYTVFQRVWDTDAAATPYLGKKGLPHLEKILFSM